jgi:hypothetical protein
MRPEKFSGLIHPRAGIVSDPVPARKKIFPGQTRDHKKIPTTPASLPLPERFVSGSFSDGGMHISDVNLIRKSGVLSSCHAPARFKKGWPTERCC